METTPAKHILIAPLDWGLGHTTRCIPIIRHILQQGHRVTVAGNEVQQQLIRAACPTALLTKLEGYNVGYSKNKNTFLLTIISQLPRLVRTIKAEHHWLLQFAKDHQVDGIISDNRYGLHHPEIPSVIMTHQLQVQTGLGRFIDRMIRPLHYQFLVRFNNCWVVDKKDYPGLAGRLSHPNNLPDAAQYIGWLSQMTQVQVPRKNTRDYLLILLSGPEPQRTLLSELLWQQALQYKGEIVFVEGSPQKHSSTEIPTHIQYHGRLGATALQPLIANARRVICRSGYSTLMDLVLLGKEAILIPTPGQTEQLYLAKMLQEAGLFYAQSQQGFQLDDAMQGADKFLYHRIAKGSQDHTTFIPVLDAWINGL